MSVWHRIGLLKLYQIVFLVYWNIYQKYQRTYLRKKLILYSLYLNIIIIIGNFIGETKAIYENSGVDEWSRRCQNIKDNQFLHILQLAKDAIESMEQPEEIFTKRKECERLNC